MAKPPTEESGGGWPESSINKGDDAVNGGGKKTAD
jgi:hypothetical protein